MTLGLPTLVLGVLLLSLGCTSQSVRSLSSNETAKGPAPIVFMSDYGTDGDGVAIVKGVILSMTSEASIVDLTHQVQAFSVKDGARLVNNTAAYYPRGTVFLTLIDRHSSGPRRGIVLKSKKGQYFVQPDNGIVTLVAERDGIEEIREIGAGAWLDAKTVASTHAWREVYPPIAAHLAQNEDFSNVGPAVTKYLKLDLRSFKLDDRGVVGEVIALDLPFGNLVTNITSASLLNAGYSLTDKVHVTVGAKEFHIPFVKTFDDVPVGELLVYIDSTDHVAMAVNQGNFAAKHKIKAGTKVTLFKAIKKQE